MKVNELDQKARELARNFKKLESELLNIIIEIEKKKIFYKLGFNSLFAYATEALELSPSQAYNFIKVARKSIEIPQLQSKIEEGQLSVSKAQKLTAVLNLTNQDKWFQLAKVTTHKQLEREIAIDQPQTAIQEVATFKSPALTLSEKITIKKNIPRIELKMGVSEKLMLQFRRAQDLESSKSKSNKSLEQTLEAILEIYLNKTDPLKIAKRQKVKGKLEKTTFRFNKQDKITSSLKRAPIEKMTFHNLQLRDQSRCTHIDIKGRRCSTRRYLQVHQVHHIHPVAKGGSNQLENLTLLCVGHHRTIHAQE